MFKYYLTPGILNRAQPEIKGYSHLCGNDEAFGALKQLFGEFDTARIHNVEQNPNGHMVYQFWCLTHKEPDDDTPETHISTKRIRQPSITFEKLTNFEEIVKAATLI